MSGFAAYVRSTPGGAWILAGPVRLVVACVTVAAIPLAALWYWRDGDAALVGLAVLGGRGTIIAAVDARHSASQVAALAAEAASASRAAQGASAEAREAVERVSALADDIHAHDRHERISRVEAVLNDIDGFLFIRTITGEEADQLGRRLYQEAEFSGETNPQLFTPTSKLVDALLDYPGHPTRQGTAHEMREIKAAFPAAQREWEEIRARAWPRWGRQDRSVAPQDEQLFGEIRALRQQKPG